MATDLIISQREKIPVSSRITFQRKYVNLLSSTITQRDEFINVTFSSEKIIETNNLFAIKGNKPFLFYCVREEEKLNRVKLPYATK